MADGRNIFSLIYKLSVFLLLRTICSFPFLICSLVVYILGALLSVCVCMQIEVRGLAGVDSLSYHVIWGTNGGSED